MADIADQYNVNILKAELIENIKKSAEDLSFLYKGSNIKIEINICSDVQDIKINITEYHT